MMKAVLPALCAALLAGTLSANAQPPSGAGAEGKRPPRGERMQDCAKAADPKACEERRQKFRDAAKRAREACAGKEGAERRECLAQHRCAQARDPAQCMARAKERAERHKARAERREKAREACKGKEGEALRDCLREQRGRGPRKPEGTG
jgi:Spy/CpxP family protein refolding chaperone